MRTMIGEIVTVAYLSDTISSCRAVGHPLRFRTVGNEERSAPTPQTGAGSRYRFVLISASARAKAA